MAKSAEERAKDHAAHSRRYYYANKEKVRAKDMARRAANPEKYRIASAKSLAKYKKTKPERAKAVALAAQARYRAKNREKRLAQADEWRAANPDRVREHYRSWVANNRDHHRELIRRRRARLQDAYTTGVSANDWREILEAFNGECAYCGSPADTMDHVQPITRGGKDEPANIVPACRPCNSSKRDATLLELLMKPRRLVMRRMFGL